MRLVVGEHACRQCAAQHRARVGSSERAADQVGPCGRACARAHMLPEVVVTAQKGLAHPQPNMLARVRARTTRAEARVDVEAGSS